MSVDRDAYPRKFGKYHLLGPLAQGGMGALYLAASGDQGLERLLVVKTVLPHLADSEYLSRFRDEAKTVVKLSHGNLVPVFDAGQVNGELFLAMDFVEGKNLRAIWNRCAKVGVAFPVDVAVYIVKEVCRGLAYAHRYGNLKLVHRDVSPPNVLVSYSGEVKLTDFGLASSTLKLEKTAPGVIYGKVAYMAPEQARGEAVDGRADVYATGIILWELLTGRQLFPPGKDAPSELLNRARNPLVQKPSERAPRVPTALDSICLKALASDKDQRYGDAEELRKALSEWLGQESPTTEATKLEAFMHRLFEQDIDAGRNQRHMLLQKTRERVSRTLPPTHELVRALERLEESGGLAGRRAEDRGHDEADRRRGDRRSDRAISSDSERAGGAVDVPRPSPDGRTVVPSNTHSGALAALAEPEAARPPTELEGLVLEGRYRLVRHIGEGGMGRVFLAEHVEIGKQVAVKILHQVYSRMPELVERFRREARAASRIGHPNIVDVTDSGKTTDGSIYFVMEYLDGVDLSTVIERQGAIGVDRALRIGSQICRALSAAHAAGIIHRDLKPENVFLIAREGASDFVKVLDFGIAKSTEAEQARDKKLTQPGLAMGTPEYMAPEQAAGKPANERSDIYSVGAILYEMLTGTPPYVGQNFMEILSKKATEEPRAPRSMRPELSAAVEVTVQRAMARDPLKRPISMEALDYELTKCLAGRGPAVAQVLGLKSGTDVGSGFPRTDPMIDIDAIPRPASSPDDGAAIDSLATHEPSAATRRARRRRLVAIGLGSAIALAAVGVVMLRGDDTQVGPPPVAPVAGPLSEADAGKSATSVDAGSETSTDAGAVAIATPGPDAGAGVVAPDAGIVTPPHDEPKDPGNAPPDRREVDRMLRDAEVAVRDLNWVKAGTLYQRVASGSFRQKDGYLGLAEVAFQTKQNDKVIRYAKRAGKSARALMLLGHAYFKQADYKQALSYYDQVLAKNPSDGEAQRAADAARRKIGK